MATVIRKDMRGNWNGETVEMISDTLQLSITTMKRHTGDLVTIASCEHVSGSVVSHRVYQVFSQIIERSHPKRITSKVVENQHLNVYLPMVRDLALRHYNMEVTEIFA